MNAVNPSVSTLFIQQSLFFTIVKYRTRESENSPFSNCLKLYTTQRELTLTTIPHCVPVDPGPALVLKVYYAITHTHVVPNIPQQHLLRASTTQMHLDKEEINQAARTIRNRPQRRHRWGSGRSLPLCLDEKKVKSSLTLADSRGRPPMGRHPPADPPRTDILLDDHCSGRYSSNWWNVFLFFA